MFWILKAILIFRVVSCDGVNYNSWAQPKISFLNPLYRKIHSLLCKLKVHYLHSNIKLE